VIRGSGFLRLDSRLRRGRRRRRRRRRRNHRALSQRPSLWGACPRHGRGRAAV